MEHSEVWTLPPFLSRKNKRVLWLLFGLMLGLVVLLSSCKSHQKHLAPGQEKMPSCPDAFKVTVKNISGLDGCTWVFEMATGEKLEPVNLHEFLPEPVDGSKVWVSFRDVKTMSVCMVGRTIAVTCLQRVKE